MATPLEQTFNSETVIAGLGIHDPERARANLESIRERVPEAVLRTLPPLLAESPNPDSALNLFERLTASEPPGLYQLFVRHPQLVHYALAIFGYSEFLGETLIQNPDIFHLLAREKGLDLTHSLEEFRESFARFQSRSFETDAALLLARFKRREYIRIVLRDVLGIATLAETTSEISALADVLIEEALREADLAVRNRYGAPVHVDPDGRLVDTPFAVLALGKLGGDELNYSSDIDLLFVFGDGDAPPDAPISLQEYFIRLAQQVTEILSRQTREGAAFRIDLRLRPQGGEGEPAVALSHALEYYGHRAHDWELQALIKCRHAAGDQALAREFIRGVQQYVYTPDVNFAAIETALRSREKIWVRRRRQLQNLKGEIDVKVDRGGIRDIEFLVQCLQRVYGGKEKWLRSGGTLFSLQKLHDKAHLTGKDFHALTTTYVFLRKVEHRMQLRHGQQTHRVPQSGPELRILARAISDATRSSAPEAVISHIRERMAAVAEIYHRIVHQQQAQAEREDADDFYLQPASVVGREGSQQQMLERLADDAPGIHAIAQSALAPHTTRNLYRFLSSAFTSSERYATVIGAPEAVERALAIFEKSEYLTEILIRHPEEVLTLSEIPAATDEGSELFETEQNGPPPVHSAVEYAASAALPRTEKFALLRQHYRGDVFRAGARDVLAPRCVFESLAQISAADDEAIRAAFLISGAPKGFAVMALGRLGTQEADLLSDADLVFLRDETLDPHEATHIAEQVIEALSSYTREGMVLPVDTRLRPSGAEGELVTTPSHLGTYFAAEAQPWEALTYTKLRLIAGDRELEQRAFAARGTLMQRYRAEPAFLQSVREMREKLERASEDDFKSGRGGMYDIDFIVTALTIRHGLDSTFGNIRDRLRNLGARQLLSPADATELQAAATLLRAVEHAVRLVTGRPRKEVPVAVHARHAVEALVSGMLGRKLPAGVEHALEYTRRLVRPIYERLVT